jgi:hypothetical protein
MKQTFLFRYRNDRFNFGCQSFVSITKLKWLKVKISFRYRNLSNMRSKFRFDIKTKQTSAKHFVSISKINKTSTSHFVSILKQNKHQLNISFRYRNFNLTFRFYIKTRQNLSRTFRFDIETTQRSEETRGSTVNGN